MDAAGQNTHRSALLDGNSGTQWEGIMGRNALGRGGRNLLHGEGLKRYRLCGHVTASISVLCGGEAVLNECRNECSLSSANEWKFCCLQIAL